MLRSRDGSKDEFANSTIALSRQDLAFALAKTLDINEDLATKIVNYYTFDQEKVEFTLWSRPLFNTSAGLILIVFPLVCCHPMRLLTTWSKEAEHLRQTHNERGWRFEAKVLTVVSITINDTSLPGEPKVFGTGLKPKDPSIGDIDVLLIVGNTALVIECRNGLHPATPHEYWSVAAGLQNKKEQALRKRDYLSKHRNNIEEALAGIPPREAIRNIERVVALVVSNSYIFEGKQLEEPYFCHLDTLFNFIISGGSLFVDIVDGEEVTYKVTFPGATSEPSDAWIWAFSNPPKAEFYQQCLKLVDFPIPVLDPDDHGVIRSQWVYSPPETGKLRALLDKCSFAGSISAN